MRLFYLDGKNRIKSPADGTYSYMIEIFLVFFKVMKNYIQKVEKVINIQNWALFSGSYHFIFTRFELFSFALQIEKTIIKHLYYITLNKSFFL